MVAYLYNLGVKRQYGGDACAGHSYIHPKGICCRIHEEKSADSAIKPRNRWQTPLQQRSFQQFFDQKYFLHQVLYLLHKIRFIPTNLYARNLLRHMLNQTFFTQRTQELECKKVSSRKLCHAFYTCFVVAA